MSAIHAPNAQPIVLAVEWTGVDGRYHDTKNLRTVSEVTEYPIAGWDRGGAALVVDPADGAARTIAEILAAHHHEDDNVRHYVRYSSPDRHPLGIHTPAPVVEELPSYEDEELERSSREELARSRAKYDELHRRQRLEELADAIGAGVARALRNPRAYDLT